MSSARAEGNYEEFSRLYDERKDIYERARKELYDILNELLGDLRKREQWRFRYQLENGRVKEKGRLFAKAEAQCPDASAEEIFQRIPDIVGVRVVCNNLSDVQLVAMAIRDVAIKEARRLRVHKSSEAVQDNVANPLPSGYRALHLLVQVPVHVARKKTWICCEIQVRTLLQDAWGILTHEDIYKPDVPPPQLVERLSKRLGDALAVLDEIAQDIREEIEKEAAPPGPPETAPKPRQVPALAAGGITAQALVQAFRSALGREPVLTARSVELLLEKLANDGVASVEVLETALRASRQEIDALYAEYGRTPTDFDYVFDASTIRKDSAFAQHFLRGWLDDVAWAEKYEVGQEVPVRIRRTVPYGAFVELQDGTTGLIHISELADRWVDAPSDVVEEGAIYKARIISVDSGRRRLGLSLKRARG